MPRRNRIFAAFAFVQLIGLVCSWLWNYRPAAASSFLWGVGFLTLLPGNLLGGLITERLFWRSGLSLVKIGVLSSILTVAIDAFVWVGVALMIGGIRGRARSAKGE
jgi:hypothetical protein